MRFHNVKMAAVISIGVLLLAGCKKHAPLENTDAYIQLHGIVNDGKTTNEITLVNDRNGNRPKLRFPPQVFVNPSTRGTHDPEPVPIKKGFANTVHVYLYLNDELKLNPASGRNPANPVEITLNASSEPDNPEKVEVRIQEIARLSVRTTDKPEWKLREYTPTIAGHLQGYSYVPFDDGFKSIEGARMYIGCHSNANGPTDCSSRFSSHGGLSVSYNFDSRVLSHWREIYQEVVKFTDSVLVK